MALVNPNRRAISKFIFVITLQSEKVAITVEKRLGRVYIMSYQPTHVTTFRVPQGAILDVGLELTAV